MNDYDLLSFFTAGVLVLAWAIGFWTGYDFRKSVESDYGHADD